MSIYSNRQSYEDLIIKAVKYDELVEELKWWRDNFKDMDNSRYKVITLLLNMIINHTEVQYDNENSQRSYRAR